MSNDPTTPASDETPSEETTSHTADEQPTMTERKATHLAVHHISLGSDLSSDSVQTMMEQLRAATGVQQAPD